MEKNLNYEQSQRLFERAARVIPGGIYGHTSPASVLPMRSPYFAQSGGGCRYRDIDGNDYIDFMCGYGPIILGYRDADVEEAADAQRVNGDCFNHPTKLTVELAELLTDRVRFADWCVFAKNGSDLTTWALQVAREYTGRKKVLKIKGVYHGTDPWCAPTQGGIIEEDRAHVHSFLWNDLNSLEHQLKRFKGQVGAIFVTPYHHPAFADAQLPAAGFFKGVQEICQREGILLILDDIRAGFRLHACGSHEHFGFEPDITIFCKALANGYTISAALGRKELKNAASKVYLAGSYWNSGVPMAAALACLKKCNTQNVVKVVKERGEQLIGGMEKLAWKFGEKLLFSGPPAMPTMRFDGDHNFMRTQDFCAFAMEEGVYLHPHHNWFLCAAHKESDIDEALQRLERAFERLANTTRGTLHQR